MTEPPKKKESKITLIRRGYDNLVKTVVRPPRIAYTTEDLGPTLKALRGAVYERTDFEVVHNKLKLKCSRWAREGEPRPKKVVLYLHSNSSCRLAVVRSPVLATCACARAALVSFDFAGCGISDGDVVTLRKSRGRYVDYFSGGDLKIKDGRLERDGRSLLISGIDQSDWKFKFTNGEFKTEIVDQTTPRDPAAVDRAMELVDG